jgi:hypothetical protein
LSLKAIACGGFFYGGEKNECGRKDEKTRRREDEKRRKGEEEEFGRKIRKGNPKDKKQKWKPGLRFHCDFAFDAVFTKPCCLLRYQYSTTSRILVGTIGLEPTTPTMSR